MNLFKLFLLLNLILFLFSCGTAKKAFTNQKKNSSDEFMVEKKSPLVMPPDYGELSAPKNDQNNLEIEDTKIKELIVNEENKDSNNELSDTNKNFEETLIEKIKKN